MITRINADLLEHPLDGIIHQCNCFHTMGSGIAAQIRKKYPEAYDADLMTKKGSKEKLGTSSIAIVGNKYIFNLYGQYRYGMGERHTSYDAVYEGLVNIKALVDSNSFIKTLGLPEKMGCCRGGGDWRIVSAIIDSVFSDSKIDLFICNYPEI